MSETWVPSTFEVQLGFPGKRRRDDKPTTRKVVSGETWGAFGIHRCDDEGVRSGDYVVTHLPTGRVLVSTEEKRLTRRFVKEVAPLTDWQAAVPGPCPPDIWDTFLTAWHRARGAMFHESQAVAGGAP